VVPKLPMDCSVLLLLKCNEWKMIMINNRPTLSGHKENSPQFLVSKVHASRFLAGSVYLLIGAIYNLACRYCCGGSIAYLWRSAVKAGFVAARCAEVEKLICKCRKHLCGAH